MTSTWGNWGNYAVYGQSYAHSNSPAEGSWTRQSHSLSWGSTSVTTMPDTLAGSLAAYKRAIAEVRASLEETGTEGPLNEGLILASQVPVILNNAKGTVGPYYQYGTLEIGVHANHSVSGGHSSHANARYNNTKASAPYANSGHANTTGASWTYSSSDMQAQALAKTSNPISSYATPSGKAMKSQANAILAILNGAKMVGNTLKSFGTRSFVGDNRYYYATNHSSHSSYSA